MRKLLLILLMCLPMTIFSSTKVPSYDLDCLIYNVYFESRGEPKKGKLAVALVTLNRSDKGDSICKTVYAPKQFSWTAKAQKATINVKEWKASKEAALEAYMNRDVLGKFTATHYHNDTVSPNWGLRKVAVIGKHTFYKA